MFEIQITFGETVKDLQLETIKSDASTVFGGFTILEGEGGWVDDTGDVVEETARILKVRGEMSDFEGQITDKPEEWAKAAARHLKRQSDEDEIMWDVRNLQSGGME